MGFDVEQNYYEDANCFLKFHRYCVESKQLFLHSCEDYYFNEH